MDCGMEKGLQKTWSPSGARKLRDKSQPGDEALREQSVSWRGMTIASLQTDSLRACGHISALLTALADNIEHGLQIK